MRSILVAALLIACCGTDESSDAGHHPPAQPRPPPCWRTASVHRQCIRCDSGADDVYMELCDDVRSCSLCPPEHRVADGCLARSGVIAICSPTRAACEDDPLTCD